MTDNQNSRTILKDFQSWKCKIPPCSSNLIFGLDRTYARLTCSLLIGLFTVELVGLCHSLEMHEPNRETILSYMEINLYWSRLQWRSRSWRFSRYLYPLIILIPSSSHMWFSKTTFIQGTRPSNEALLNVLFVSPGDGDISLKSILQVAQLVRQGVNPCLPNSKNHHDIPLPQGVMSSVCKYIRCK